MKNTKQIRIIKMVDYARIPNSTSVVEMSSQDNIGVLLADVEMSNQDKVGVLLAEYMGTTPVDHTLSAACEMLVNSSHFGGVHG